MLCVCVRFRLRTELRKFLLAHRGRLVQPTIDENDLDYIAQPKTLTKESQQKYLYVAIQERARKVEKNLILPRSESTQVEKEPDTTSVTRTLQPSLFPNNLQQPVFEQNNSA